MRTGRFMSVSPADLRRLQAIIKDRNTAQKHVWRAEIVLCTADGVGTNEIMRRTGKSKTCVWRWQERFIEEGFEGLLRDKTRPSRIKRLGGEAAERVVALTLGDTSRHVSATLGMFRDLVILSVAAILRRELSLPDSKKNAPSFVKRAGRLFVFAANTGCLLEFSSVDVSLAARDDGRDAPCDALGDGRDVPRDARGGVRFRVAPESHFLRRQMFRPRSAQP